MTTKEYLLQVRRLRKCVDDKIENINILRSKLTSISVNTSDINVQSSSDPDKLGAMIADILERESELQPVLTKYLNMERTISAQIDGMENPTYRHLLYSKYINDLTFEKIAVGMDRNWRHVIRMHGKALAEFEKKYGENYRMS